MDYLKDLKDIFAQKQIIINNFMKRIEKLKKQNPLFNTMDDFKKGDKVRAVEKRIINYLGKNHGVNCDCVMKFVEEYGQGTAQFKTKSGEIITLKINCVQFV